MAELAQMDKYSSYKETGINWIGKIPDSWAIEKAKWLFLKADRKPQPNDEIVTCFRDGEVTLRKNRRTEGFTNALKEHGYQRICKGDLVIHAMDAFAGAIGVADSDGKSTPVYAACIPRLQGEVNPYFYAYYMRDLALSGFIVSLAKGIRERSTDFRYNDFAELPLPFPSYIEQTAIANFLDKKTAQIDEAIAIKEKQIELFKERKQIIIQQAVTQGLNPAVPMKDSGVDWIGEIPKHWNDVTKIKYISSLKGRQGWQGLKAEEYTDEGPHVLSSAHFNNYIIDWNKCPRVSYERYLMDTNIQLQIGDILLMKDGANMGKLAFVSDLPGPACLNCHLLLFRSLKDKLSGNIYFNSKYMFFHMMCAEFQDYVKINGTGATFLGISQESIGNYQLWLPPMDEQEMIVSFLERESLRYDEAISQQVAQIDKLKEYKTTLVNSAVTGKIKVPGVV